MSFSVEKDVMVPMRDGVTLATDLFLPNGSACPALLVRMGYNKNVMQKAGQWDFLPSTLAFVEAGYAVVWQDCRGSYNSNGFYATHVDDPADGADTVAWILEQPWCDGNVGSFGTSYLGMVQWSTASAHPTGLKAIAPVAAAADFYRGSWYSAGGARNWFLMFLFGVGQAAGFEAHAIKSGTGNPALLEQLLAAANEPAPHFARLPMIAHPGLEGQAWWQDWMNHPDRDQYWVDVSPSKHLHEITTPALQIVGWFDCFVFGMTRGFTHMRAKAATPEARAGQRLLIGPWDHGYAEGIYAAREFGPSANHVSVDFLDRHLRFFDRHLRGKVANGKDMAPVRIFVMGIDAWRDEQDWPLPDTCYVDYYLDGSGAANTLDGDGLLTPVAPTAAASETIRYDPLNPVPSLGGRYAALTHAHMVLNSGPVDQRPVEGRDDVLCFATPALERPVEVTGEVSLVLHASSSAMDTDFTGKLVDVFPDGRAIYLTDGILRARYRNTVAEPELLEPGKVYELVVDLGPTSNVFLPGHQIRLEISSSNFPRYDRNTNSGGIIAYDSEADVVVAINRILHGPDHPSRLVLPIISRP